MLYSVWNWDKGLYDVYEAAGEGLGDRPEPRTRINEPRSRVGRQIESLLMVLPAGAEFVGRSDFAKGRVAVTASEALGAEVDYDNPLKSHPWWTLGLWIGGFLLSVKAIEWLGASIARKIT